MQADPLRVRHGFAGGPTIAMNTERRRGRIDLRNSKTVAIGIMTFVRSSPRVRLGTGNCWVLLMLRTLAVGLLPLLRTWVTQCSLCLTPCLYRHNRTAASHSAASSIRVTHRRNILPAFIHRERPAKRGSRKEPFKEPSCWTRYLQ